MLVYSNFQFCKKTVFAAFLAFAFANDVKLVYHLSSVFVKHSLKISRVC